MLDPPSKPRRSPKKRHIGRPFSDDVVGREGLLVATERLLRILPPSKISFGRIAAEANVDPSLIRYHFGSRTALFLAVVDRVTSHSTLFAGEIEEPGAALAEHISNTMRFVRSAPFMHRLMIDEMTDAGTAEARQRVVDLNYDLVAYYKRMLKTDRDQRSGELNPLLVHILVLGACDFFASAESIIADLTPAGENIETISNAFEQFLTRLLVGLTINDR